MILEGKVSRHALLCQGDANPRALEDVPGLSELFDDQRLRLFLKAQMQTWSTAAHDEVPRVRTGSLMASVALMTAILAGVYFASQRSTMGHPTPEASPHLKQL